MQFNSEISKYEFYNELLGGVTFFRITPGITWTQHVYIYIMFWRESL